MRKSDVGTTVKSQQEIQRSLLLQQDKKNVPEEVKTQNVSVPFETKTLETLFRVNKGRAARHFEFLTFAPIPARLICLDDFYLFLIGNYVKPYIWQLLLNP
jgi:hypothetical protein